MFKIINKDTIKDSSEVIKNANKKTSIPSIINAQMVVRGNMTSDNIIEIFGRVEGDIKAEVVTVREGGTLIGKVEAKYVKVSGHFEGDISTAVIHITSTGNLFGKIDYGIISVEEKAQVKSEMQYNPSLLQVSKGENIICDQREDNLKIESDCTEKTTPTEVRSKNKKY